MVYAITLLAGSAVYGDLISNPLMEGSFTPHPEGLGHVAENWTAWRSRGAMPPQFYESGYAYDGLKSQDILWGDSAVTDSGGLYQHITNLQPGQQYRISAYFKVRLIIEGTTEMFGYLAGRLGIDQTSGTDPDAVGDWDDWAVVDHEISGADTYIGPWFPVEIEFSPLTDTVTLFTGSNGPAMGLRPDPWNPGEYNISFGPDGLLR